MIMKTLTDQTVMITGASSGLGLAVARQAASKGASLILLARNPDKLNEAKRHLEPYHVYTELYAADVSDCEQLTNVFQQIEQKHTRLDVLINNAGYGIFQTCNELSINDFEQMMAVNYLGTVYCTKLALPLMLRQKAGHIINIASQSGKVGTPKTSAYAASKHAVLGFTNSIRHELKPHGIFVSAVNPGPIDTPFFNLADVSGTYVKHVSAFMLHVDHVANRIVRLIEKPKRELNLPLWMDVGSKMMSLFPTLIENIAGNRLFKK